MRREARIFYFWNRGMLLAFCFVAALACLMTVFDGNSIFEGGTSCGGSFALLRLTSSNDSLMNGQEGTGR